MTALNAPAAGLSIVHRRAAVLERELAWTTAAKIDRVFALLMVLQWMAAIVVAFYYSPLAWRGLDATIHPHVWSAIGVGGIVASMPVYLAITHAGSLTTRYVIACAQMFFSALLIHLSGGRIETHFHVFGSLAFLSFYRDWRVLVPATVVVAVDHALRGIFWPQSVFGIADANNWRWLEHAGWVVFEDIFLIWACVRSAREMSVLAFRQAELETVNQRIEAEVIAKTSQLEAVTQELVTTARRAGMAEIATGVLHNVGNVLNSVNVSASVAMETLRNSEVATFMQAGQLLREHSACLPEFLTTDHRGKQLPAFLIDLSECLSAEQTTLVSELQTLHTGLEHIKQIVSDQQRYARNGTMLQQEAPADIFEEAIALSVAESSRPRVEIERRFESLSACPLDKHKILQVLNNLLANARRSVEDSGRPDKCIVACVRRAVVDDQPRLIFSVKDNGVGIPSENLTMIFSHGYTTRPDGHGFGLHSAANCAREMGGDLKVASAGKDQGAEFTLELPLLDSTNRETIAADRELA